MLENLENEVPDKVSMLNDSSLFSFFVSSFSWTKKDHFEWDWLSQWIWVSELSARVSAHNALDGELPALYALSENETEMKCWQGCL